MPPIYILIYFMLFFKPNKPSEFQHRKIIYMSNMFEGCEKLEEVNLFNFNTINVTNMCAMFSKCYSLKGANVAYFNLTNLTCMRWMFFGCENLIDLDGFLLHIIL